MSSRRPAYVRGATPPSRHPGGGRRSGGRPRSASGSPASRHARSPPTTSVARVSPSRTRVAAASDDAYPSWQSTRTRRLVGGPRQPGGAARVQPPLEDVALDDDRVQGRVDLALRPPLRLRAGCRRGPLGRAAAAGTRPAARPAGRWRAPRRPGRPPRPARRRRSTAAGTAGAENSRVSQWMAVARSSRSAVTTPTPPTRVASRIGPSGPSSNRPMVVRAGRVGVDRQRAAGSGAEHVVHVLAAEPARVARRRACGAGPHPAPRSAR